MTFIYTSCPDVCPLLTEKMAQVQDELGPDFGPRVAFVSITVDPEHDTPEVLKDYAESHGADPRAGASSPARRRSSTRSQALRRGGDAHRRRARSTTLC